MAQLLFGAIFREIGEEKRARRRNQHHRTLSPRCDCAQFSIFRRLGDSLADEQQRCSVPQSFSRSVVGIAMLLRIQQLRFISAEVCALSQPKEFPVQPFAANHLPLSKTTNERTTKTRQATTYGGGALKSVHLMTRCLLVESGISGWMVVVR